MGIVQAGIAMSLDGYVAGPHQSLDPPSGRAWMGACIMGRNMLARAGTPGMNRGRAGWA
ncbi:hypothetical protein [Arthrobacter alpinus]|uniref:hypothetical protein n=1 Tax=Arthrobacter alpinus TaxID=656366 RepID=UPI001FCD37CB|nr:hypothetical protein [Arthrobacter alpinus]